MYIKLSTLEFPRYEGDIRLEHPEISEEQTGPTFPCPDTYAPVIEVQPPPFDHKTQVCESSQPIQDESGNWKMNWIIRDATPEEIEVMENEMQRVLEEELQRYGPKQ